MYEFEHSHLENSIDVCLKFNTGARAVFKVGVDAILSTQPQFLIGECFAPVCGNTTPGKYYVSRDTDKDLYNFIITKAAAEMARACFLTSSKLYSYLGTK